MNRRCDADGCELDAVVGLNGSWLCMTHFEERIAWLGERLRELGRVLHLNVNIEPTLRQMEEARDGR